MIEQLKKMKSTRLQLAKELRFFDSNLWLGPAEGFPFAEEMQVNSLLQAAEKNFIIGGLISHWMGKTVSPQQGNKMITEATCAIVDNWYAVYTALPLFPEEPGPLPGQDKLFERVRGIRIFPKSHKFLLKDFVVASLFDFMIQTKLPLFIWHTELDWAELHEIAGKFPKLTIIVETQPQKIIYHMRTLLPLMRERSNVLLETSNLAGQDYLEYGVNKLGPHRFIFGSFLPIFDPLSPIGMILDAEIPKEHKSLIAGENFRRIIAEVQI